MMYAFRVCIYHICVYLFNFLVVVPNMKGLSFLDLQITLTHDRDEAGG